MGANHPEGVDVLQYDALDRLTKVTRTVGGIVVAVEDYAYNALGAISVHAGIGVDHQRPRLDGGGAADAALPNTLDAQPVALDPAGRVTALRGVDFGWSLNGNLTSIDGTLIGSDAFMRRVWLGDEFYVNEGANRIARVAYVQNGLPPGEIKETFLYDGIDHPLRVGTGVIQNIAPPALPPVYVQSCVLAAYFELDLAGNVRRLRGDGGTDLGGYRYSAFGKTLEDTVLNDLVPGTGYSRATQPLRWKGRPRIAGTGAGELYDMRARFWSPDLGAFLSIDEYAFHDANTTLWGWPNQSPARYSDPTGHCGPGCVALGAEVGFFAGAGAYVATAPMSSMSWSGLFGAGLEGAIIGGAFGAHPYAGIVALGALQVGSDKDLWKFGLAASALGETGGGAASAGEECPSSAARGTGEAVEQGSKLGGFKSAAKWEGQMAKRGWTPQQIGEAMQKGERFGAENLVNKGNSATRYVHPETGRSVVVDDVTKEIIHVGGDGFKY